MNKYQVFDDLTGESHGIYDTLAEAQGCVEFDHLEYYTIWRGDVLVVDEPAPCNS